MNIFQRISLKLKVIKRFKPFFANQNDSLKSLEIMDFQLTPDIVSIYEKICELPKNKYKKERILYETYLSRIEEHNTFVDRANSLVFRWSLSKILENPLIVEKQYLVDCSTLADELKKYKLTGKYKIFKKEIIEVFNNFEVICRQYELHKQYVALFDFGCGNYINEFQKNNVKKEANRIILDCAKDQKFYYPFDLHDNLDSFVEENNKKYFDNKIGNRLFDSINGRSLDLEQRKAVLADEKSLLVVAGAGSGKTLTICGKVEYLLKECGVKPEDILLLSYSKKSADDLQSKINKIDKNLTVGTFHKIGLDILKETQNKVFMVEDQYKAIIEKYFREEIKNRPHILQTILTYYGLYISTFKHEKKYDNPGDLFEDLKKADFITLRNQLVSLTNDYEAKETIKKELVKSFEELAIANWYFINGIDYTYEAPYEHDVSTNFKRQYMPDFKLAKNNIYHEHYGINQFGQASQYEGEEASKYVETMNWKRQIHQNYETDCIETYSYEFENGTIFKKLEKELKKRGVEFNPLSSEEIMKALNSIYENRLFKSFISLLSTFLSLYKSSYRDDSAIETFKNGEFRNNYEKQRASLFLDIVKDLYQYYMGYLKDEEKIDFDDMILQSTQALDKTNHYRFKYIIVDEFQDISVSRMKFLKRLIQQGDSKLFAVGDDWQAIYRFSGCDLDIFLNFSKYFDYSKTMKITTTHRNSQELQDIAGPFIKKNPEQFDKRINSNKHLERPIQIMFYEYRKYDAFLDVLELISKKDKKANVLVLGRNNKDIEDIELDNRIYKDYKNSDEVKTVIRCSFFPEMKITYSTVHGSKGLEDDYVILINADDNRIGFPNKMEDDELLDMVLSSKSEFEYAEERRLWYVALTRTRNYTYIIADKDNPSIFLDEIIDKCKVMNSNYSAVPNNDEILCPCCKSGRLVLRKNESDGSSFYGCSNYPYCDYSINDMIAVKRNKRCPRCGDFLIFRKGRWGAFLGCHNYPNCNYTEEYDKNN